MSVETLGDAWRAGWTVSARCKGRNARTKNGTKPCLQQVDLDMRTLLWTRGADFPIAMLSDRLMCPSCRSRHVFLIFDIPGNGSRAMVS
ncbi:hypothetical protein ABIE08_004090 [Kaistia defluvii]|jgi:hypothetical protein|uniref:Uncharacterized protein n=1 Tax=Kaistia defluvii TaxID=410841 RepID=A0ABV2R4C4_9HYPH